MVLELAEKLPDYQKEMKPPYSNDIIRPYIRNTRTTHSTPDTRI